ETCYKLLPSGLVRALPLQGRSFEIDPEMTAYMLRAGYRIFEVPIGYKPRKEKKLRPWKDGWSALAMLLRCRFTKPPRLADPGLGPVKTGERLEGIEVSRKIPTSPL